MVEQCPPTDVYVNETFGQTERPSHQITQSMFANMQSNPYYKQEANFGSQRVIHQRNEGWYAAREKVMRARTERTQHNRERASMVLNEHAQNANRRHKTAVKKTVQRSQRRQSQTRPVSQMHSRQVLWSKEYSYKERTDAYQTSACSPIIMAPLTYRRWGLSKSPLPLMTDMRQFQFSIDLHQPSPSDELLQFNLQLRMYFLPKGTKVQLKASTMPETFAAVVDLIPDEVGSLTLNGIALPYGAQPSNPKTVKLVLDIDLPPGHHNPVLPYPFPIYLMKGQASPYTVAKNKYAYSRRNGRAKEPAEDFRTMYGPDLDRFAFDLV